MRKKITPGYFLKHVKKAWCHSCYHLGENLGIKTIVGQVIISVWNDRYFVKYILSAMLDRYKHLDIRHIGFQII